MGCCVSSDIAKTNNKNNKTEASCPSNPQNLQDRALVPEPETTPTTLYTKSTKPPKSLSPSPLLLEEETVKEVLSETPTVAPKPNPPPPPPQQQQQQQQKLLKLPTFPKIQEEKKPLQEKDKNAPHEISEEDSEMYSFVTESVSTSAITSTTTTTTDQNHRFIIRDYEDDGSSEVITGYKNAPNKVPKRPSLPNRSPARRSPAKRTGGDSGQPSIGLREMSASQAAARRRILAGNGGRSRDSGESSWRRSGSPVTRAEAVGRPGVCRSPSARRVAAAVEDRRVVGEEEHWGGKESLEDPLVSLECFIFL